MTAEEYVKAALKTESCDWGRVIGRVIGETDEQTEIVQAHIKELGITPEYETKPLRLLHAAAGLVTEAIELIDAFEKADYINGREELGDLSWYSAIASDVLGVSFDRMHSAGRGSVRFNWTHEEKASKLPIELLEKGAKEITFHAGEVVDLLVKKRIFYGKDLAEPYIAQHIGAILFHMENMAPVLDTEMPAVWDRNIEKLTNKDKGRYRTGVFTESEAQTRDLVKEREILAQDEISQLKAEQRDEMKFDR